MQTLYAVLAVFVGGGAGSLARWGLSVAMAPFTGTFPAGTLAANVCSCYVAGLVAGLSARAGWGTETVRLLLLTGFCGGFSTFSTLVRELHDFGTAQRPGTALWYAILSFGLGMAALLAGMWQAKP